MKKQRHRSTKTATISAPREQELNPHPDHKHDLVSPSAVRYALHKPNTTSHSTIITLQQTYGNRAVQRLIQQRPTAATVQRVIKNLFKNLFNLNSKSEDEEETPKRRKAFVNSNIPPASIVKPEWDGILESPYRDQFLQYVIKYDKVNYEAYLAFKDYKTKAQDNTETENLAKSLFDYYIKNDIINLQNEKRGRSGEEVIDYTKKRLANFSTYYNTIFDWAFASAEVNLEGAFKDWRKNGYKL